MNITITFPTESTTPQPPPEPMRVKGWRALHVAEGGRAPNPLGSPGIIPPYNPTVGLTMTKDIQLMSYDLMAHFHPAVRADRGKWKIAHNHAFAMNNGQANGYPARDDEVIVPHKDYITRYPDVEDSTATLPRYDKMQRTFAGSLITGKLEGKVIWCEPGVDAIDARNFSYIPGTPEAAATLQEIIDKHWYSYAVAERENSVEKIRGKWGIGIIVFPFILDRPVSYESRFFTAWDETFYPDPLMVYL